MSRKRQSAGDALSGTITIDANAIVCCISPAISTIVGTEAEALVGQSILLLLPSEQAKQKQKMSALLKDKDLLLREIRHRVANSLQIIAGLLMMKAREIQQEESRLPIEDAYSRLFALGEVNRQLSTNGGDEVHVVLYLSTLCAGLEESMIRGRPVSLKVEGQSDMTVTSETAVSLGLIVTELVINSLKHAFEANTKGQIQVVFDRKGNGWRLCVDDDGVGSTPDVKRGLVSAIIDRLARQLGARIERSPDTPGTSTSIVLE